MLLCLQLQKLVLSKPSWDMKDKENFGLSPKFSSLKRSGRNCGSSDQEVVLRPIFFCRLYSVSSKKSFAEGLELCEPRNLLFGTAVETTVWRVCCSFGLTEV